MEHGNEAALGFRFGAAAYMPDVSLIPEASLARLHGLDLLIIDALRDTPHPTHFSVSDALALIAEVGRAGRCSPTCTPTSTTPPWRRGCRTAVVPAYDGLSLSVDA